MKTDKEILQNHSPKVMVRAMMELAIVRQLLADVEKAGWTTIIHEFNGEETPDLADAIFNLDEATLEFRDRDNKKMGLVFLVMGNDGWDVISDYSTKLEEFLAPSLEVAQKCEEGNFNLTFA